MSEVVGVTLPASAFDLPGTDDVVVLYDEETENPLGGISIINSVEKARVTVHHDQEVTVSLGIKNAPGDSYVFSDVQVFATPVAATTEQVEIDVSGLRFYQIRLVNNSSNAQTAWLPALALISTRQVFL